jgi:hypothetical protein
MFSFIAIVPPHQTWYTDYYLADNTTYCYRVRGYNRVGASPYSDEFCATTLAADQTLKTISTNISDGTRIEQFFGGLDSRSFRYSDAGR